MNKLKTSIIFKLTTYITENNSKSKIDSIFSNNHKVLFLFYFLNIVNEISSYPNLYKYINKNEGNLQI